MSKAKWIGHHGKRDVVLKRLYNSSNSILDILKEVNKKSFNVDIDLSPSLKIPCRRKFKG